MFICPHCQSTLQDTFNGQFCPICNSFLGNVQNNQYIQSQGYVDHSKYINKKNKNKKKKSEKPIDPYAMYRYDTEERFSGYPYSTVNAFLIENNDYYIDAFRKNAEKKFIFHKPALFFGFLTFLYRKMYVEGFLIFALQTALSILIANVNNIILTVLFGICFNLILSFIFIPLYFNHIVLFLNKNSFNKRSISEIVPDYLYRFSKYGGANKYIILYALLTIFIAISCYTAIIPIYMFHKF